MKHAIVAALLCLLAAPCLFAEGRTLPRAFPGAEGFGACTPGGRGGRVIYVTTLEDYAPGETPVAGSLRAAIDAKGPRVILFRTGGTIRLKADLWAREPFFTLAGQTAPGGGICLRDHQFVLATHDGIIRHMRFRSGDETRLEQMAVGIFGGNNSIIDHCSMSWAIDEVMSSFGTVNNLTVQWSVIAEGLSKSFHPKGEHSKGSILNGDGGVTLHHCVYAHNAARNPRADRMLLDFRNNVLYNWGYRPGYTREAPCFMNYVNCYGKPGPSTGKSAARKLFEPGDDTFRVFITGNVLEGSPKGTADNRLLLDTPDGPEPEAMRALMVVDKPFPCPPVATDSAETALARVLAEAGATLPKRDSADTRLMEEIRTGTGRIIDTTADAGGWPELEPGTAPADTDLDGMPDEWEKARGLDPATDADGPADIDADGYTNVEEFLNGTDPARPEENCRVDAAEFTAAQRAAVDIVNGGIAEWKKRTTEAEEARKARRAEITRTLKVDIRPKEGGVLVVSFGGADMEMTPIPAGSFLMGSPEGEGGLDRERPQHKVNISRPFFMGATPVTTAQFCALFGPDARKLTPENADQPAREITWFEAGEFCAILSDITGRAFRLPTEAEWEYACRAGTTTAFYTGDTITPDQANFNALEATPFNPAGVFRNALTPVRAFPPNPWGLYDMPGNQAEYCLDRCFRKYTKEEVTDPKGPEEGGAYVLRGGKAGSKAFFLRSAYRYGYTPYVGYGFRAVLEEK